MQREKNFFKDITLAANVSVLPSVLPQGSLVYLTTDQNLYISNGSQWVVAGGDIGPLAAQVAQNTADIAVLETDVSGLNTTVSTLQGQVTTNTTNIGTLQTQVSANTLNIGTLQGEVGTIQGDIGTLQTDVAANTANIGTLQGDVSTLQGQVATNTTNIGVLQGDVSTLQTQVASNTSNITTLQGQVATNTSNIGTLQTDVAANTSSITTLQGQVSTNTTNIATNTSNITALQGQVATNTTNIGTLQTNVTTLQGQTATNTTNIATNTSNITTLQGQVSTNTTNIAALQLSVSKNYTRVRSSGTTNYVVNGDSAINFWITVNANVGGTWTSTTTWNPAVDGIYLVTCYLFITSPTTCTSRAVGIFYDDAPASGDQYLLPAPNVTANSGLLTWGATFSKQVPLFAAGSGIFVKLFSSGSSGNHTINGGLSSLEIRRLGSI
ncbi:autotransporter adhesin [Brazilian marseillevirus]|uniref:autotransporter adhesin n=1 Tax=Brazilian marseillevirus TaxID=1813599 RepID=UPI00078245FE|nr:autotransporter adhesin [Brazilian marseillevirus]AMQ10598.1 autotransporter adhesin [Brazilian marseillevirus]